MEQLLLSNAHIFVNYTVYNHPNRVSYGIHIVPNIEPLQCSPISEGKIFKKKPAGNSKIGNRKIRYLQMYFLFEGEMFPLDMLVCLADFYHSHILPRKLTAFLHLQNLPIEIRKIIGTKLPNFH